MMKLSAFTVLFALTTLAASSARAETSTAESRALFDRCVAATAQFKAAPKTLDFDLLTVALDGAEKGNMQCAGLAQRILLANAKRVAELSPTDRAKVEAAYARGFAAFGTPELKIAHEKLAVLASDR
jgi:hypothetical protein